jgi:hypothetical protein
MVNRIESILNHVAETPFGNRLLLAYSIIMLSAEALLATKGDTMGAVFISGLTTWPILLGTNWRWNQPGEHHSVIGKILALAANSLSTPPNW